jgi:hypothetical protein
MIYQPNEEMILRLTQPSLVELRNAQYKIVYPVLPIPGEVRAKAMPGTLYIHNKWIINK